MGVNQDTNKTTLVKVQNNELRKELLNLHNMAEFGVFSRVETMKSTLENIAGWTELLEVLNEDRFAKYDNSFKMVKEQLKEAIKAGQDAIEQAKENNEVESDFIKELGKNLKVEGKDVFINEEYIAAILPLARIQQLTKEPSDDVKYLMKALGWKARN